MKRILTTVMIIAAFAGMTTITSCTKTCDPGYEGTDCKTEVRAKYLGNYNASESKNGGTAYSYSGSVLTSSSNVQEIYINRIPNGTGFFNTNVKATIDGNAVTIANQNPDGDAYYITGTGAFSATTPATITFTYTVTGPNGAVPPVTVTDSYTATWTKQ